MRLDPAELPTPTDPIVNRTHALHADDAKLIARQKLRENPPPPREVTGKDFAGATKRYNEARAAHRKAQEEANTANMRAIAAASEMWDAKEAFIRTANEYAATKARETKNG